MAFSITNTPRAIDFGRNPIGFKLNAPRSVAIRATLHLAQLPVGATFELRFSDKSVVYNVVAAADSSGTQLTSTTDSAVVVADLLKNSLVSGTWNIYQTVSEISFYEKNLFDFFDLEIITLEGYYSVKFSGKKFKDPQRLASELFVRQNGEPDFVSQGLSFHSIDYSGVAYANLMGKVLRRFNPYIPAFKSATVAEIFNTRYYLKFWEYKDSGGTMFQNLLTTDTYTALFAKLPVKTFPSFAWGTPFVLLSNAPAWRETWIDAHNEISILITGAITSFDVKVKMYFDDETEATVDVATGVTCIQTKTYYIPAGYNQLPIEANTPEGAKCYRYEVIVVSEVNTVSASFIVKDRPAFGKVFRFINAMGGFDCACLLGYTSSKKNVDVETGETSLLPFYTSPSSVVADKYNDREEFDLKIMSLTTAEVNHFKEVIDSPFVFIEEGEAFVPVIITSESMDIADEQSDLHDTKLTFRYA